MRLKLTTAAALAALAVSTGAQATEFAFDPAGGGSSAINTASTIDQAPGSALAVGGQTAFNNFVSGGPASGNGFTLYYQANLNSVQDVNGANLFSNGTNNQFFTFNAGFGETVTGASSAAGVNFASFSFDASNPVNYFTMYAASALGNNLTGNGFVTNTPILSGHVSGIPTSSYTATTNSPQLLDQNGVDNWSGQQTVVGAGSSNISVTVTSVDANYFPDLTPNSKITLAIFNTSQIDPFNQADPSMCMNTQAGTCDAGTGYNDTATIGSVNGLNGSDFLFQADGNTSIKVPEPGTVALLGLGLAMIGFLGLRNRRFSKDVAGQLA